MLIALFISLLILLCIRVPIAFAIGLSSLFSLLIFSDIPLSILIPRIFNTLNSSTFLAIPFFMLAGVIMERGGISERLIRFSSSLIGHIRGGLGHVTVLTSMAFAGISGSASADTSAVGSVLIPSMIKKGYPKGYAAALTACAGSLGPIIPPSIIMIIYGSLTGLSIGKLFLAGAIPGILIGIGLMIINYFAAKKLGMEKSERASLKEVWKSFVSAFWALLAPVIIIGGIITGVFTATESGVIAVVYCFLISTFVYKEMRFSDLGEIFTKALNTTVMVMFIAATASAFGWILANEQFPIKVAGFIGDFTTNKYIVMLIVILFLLFIGCFLETIAAAIIFVPVLAVLATDFGFDPIQFATVVAICLIIGGITPPIGVLLFITNGIAKANINESIRYLWPFFGMILFVILLVAYIPFLSTFLPEFVK
jgi:tripartite ATP-independent transporter DctM subunit